MNKEVFNELVNGDNVLLVLGDKAVKVTVSDIVQQDDNNVVCVCWFTTKNEFTTQNFDSTLAFLFERCV